MLYCIDSTITIALSTNIPRVKIIENNVITFRDRSNNLKIINKDNRTIGIMAEMTIDALKLTKIISTKKMTNKPCQALFSKSDCCLLTIEESS